MPPCISTSCRAIARPSPSPPRSRVVPASAWRNRSNTCGRNPVAMPTPLSRTVNSTWPPTRVERHRDPAAARRELDRIREQVPDHLLQPLGIAGHCAGVLVQRALDRDVLGVGGGSTASIALADQRREIDGLHRQPQLSRNDAGDVEHVLDDAASAPRRCVRSSRARAASGRRAACPSASCARSRGSRSAACAARATTSRETRPSAGSRPARPGRGGRSRGRPTPTTRRRRRAVRAPR